MKATFSAVYRKDGNWWVGYVEELPGANTQGRTLEEAKRNLKEAVVLVLEANREVWSGLNWWILFLDFCRGEACLAPTFFRLDTNPAPLHTMV